MIGDFTVITAFCLRVLGIQVSTRAHCKEGVALRHLQSTTYADEPVLKADMIQCEAI